MSCLAEDTLAEYVEHRLAPDARRRAEAHIDACTPCYELFAELAHGASCASAPRLSLDGRPAHEPALELRPGDRVSRYEVRALVGAGGMGAVYEAFDPLLGRRVALKLLHGSRASTACEEMRARLVREAKALARLAHPNVVAVHDVGLAGGRVFVAMDLIEGKTLAAWLREGTASGAGASAPASPRAWQEILDVYLRAGRGLAAAHAAGLVHRDFKPANVMVGDDGRVCVTDFGLARDSGAASRDVMVALDETDEPVDPAGVLTRRGALLGSPAYMAPEQMAGDPVDARADLFSFCVALFEGLFGRRPFAGRTMRGLEASIVAERVRSPPERTEVPEWLHALVARGLRARPEDRPPTLDALLQSIERERIVRGLRRTRKMLDEAEALSRLSGGRRVAEVAHTLLEEIAGGTGEPRAPALPRESAALIGEMEMRGSDIAALIDGVKDYATLTSHFIAREGIGVLREDGTVGIDPAAWYPLPSLLRAMRAVVAVAGSRIGFELGLAVARRMRVPPGLSDIRKALPRPDILYAEALRIRPGHGTPGTLAMPAHIVAREDGERTLSLDMGGPWPADFEHGVLTGQARHFEAEAVVTHEPRPCRSRGDSSCRFTIRWGAQQDCHAAVRLEAAATVRDFLHDPYGRYLGSDHVFCWCRDPQLLGMVWWGTPAAQDVERVGPAFDVLTRPGAAPQALMLDMRHVDSVDAGVYRRIAAAMKRRRDALARTVRAQAVVRPAGMAGAVISGYFEVAPQPYPVQFFQDPVEALTWLGRPDACLVAELRAVRIALSAGSAN